MILRKEGSISRNKQRKDGRKEGRKEGNVLAGRPQDPPFLAGPPFGLLPERGFPREPPVLSLPAKGEEGAQHDRRARHGREDEDLVHLEVEGGRRS